MIEITSTANSAVKDVCKLKQKKVRDIENKFIIEGMKMLSEAVLSGIEIDCIFVQKNEYLKNRTFFDELQSEKLYVVNDAVIEKISEWKTPQGVCAVVKKSKHELEEYMSKDTAFVLVLDGVSDPGNIGTMIRTSEAAGVDCVITVNGTADCYQSKALRASMGSIFRIPVFENFEKCDIIYILRKHGIKLLSTSLDGEDVFDFDFHTDKIAAVFGNEGSGIEQEFVDKADMLVRLPMSGSVESLNVAVSAGIIMYMIKMKNY